VLLLGAEFSAARARMHDPRGAWGVQDNGSVPPGSRAKIGSMLAASTRVDMAADIQPVAQPALDVRSARPQAARRSNGGRTRQAALALKRAIELSRKVARAESTATRATAVAMVGAGRKASQANAAVKRHPWRAVLLAATAGAAVALLSRRDGGPSRDV
jgi:membrane protein